MKTKYTLIILFLIYGLSSQALDLNWKNINTDQYYQNRIQCQQLINKVKWDNLNWPKENKTTKPTFQTIDYSILESKVAENLHMEWTLMNYFGVEINNLQLQNEINRIVKNSNDKNQLNNFKSDLELYFNLTPIHVSRWEEKRDDYILKINELTK